MRLARLTALASRLLPARSPPSARADEPRRQGARRRRPEIPPRTGRRRGRRAALRRRVQGPAAQAEAPDLAPLPGGDRRARHLLRPALRATAWRCAASLEAIVAHPDGVDPATLAEVRRYTKLFWINSGPYQPPDRPQVRAQVHARGVRRRRRARPSRTGRRSTSRTAARPLERTLKRLRPSFFDPDYEPIVTNKSPGPGKDILATSANNLYVGVTMKDLDGFTEQLRR